MDNPDIDRFSAADRLQEWAIANGYGMPLREAMEAVDLVLSTPGDPA